LTFRAKALRLELLVKYNLSRLSLEKMKSVKTGMTGGRSVEWKATCGYSFTDGQSTSDDVVRSTFQTLDLFNFKTHGKLFCLLLKLSGIVKLVIGLFLTLDE
jgi:hypothetical protein